MATELTNLALTRMVTAMKETIDLMQETEAQRIAAMRLIADRIVAVEKKLAERQEEPAVLRLWVSVENREQLPIPERDRHKWYGLIHVGESIGLDLAGCHILIEIGRQEAQTDG